MGVWQGVAKAVGEISEKNYKIKEAQKDRDFAISQREGDRKHDFDLLAKRIEADNEKLIMQLRAKRAAAGATSEQYTSFYTALEQKLEGVEGAEEYLATVAQDPRVASIILDKVTDIQESQGRELTPSEIINNFTPIISQKGSQVVDTYKPESEVEEALYEQAKSEIKMPDPVVAVGGGVFNDFTKSEIEIAEDNFTSAMLDLARKDVEKLKEIDGGEASNVVTLINEAEDGNQFAMSRLADKYSNDVIADFWVSMEENPFLRPIVASGAYGSKVQRFGVLVESYNNDELSPSVKEQLKETYPQVFK